MYKTKTTRRSLQKIAPKEKRFSLFKKSLNRTKIFLLSPKRPNTHFRVTDARPRLNLASNWFRWCAVASVINYSWTSECISLSVVSFIILSTISYEDITRLYRWWDGPTDLWVVTPIIGAVNFFIPIPSTLRSTTDG